jgi:hypothetical protein
MITHKIPLESLIPHGKVSVSMTNGELHLFTNSAFATWFVKNNTRIKSYVCLPNKYKLPFRVDMTVKIDSPALYLLVGGNVLVVSNIIANTLLNTNKTERKNPRAMIILAGACILKCFRLISRI